MSVNYLIEVISFSSDRNRRRWKTLQSFVTEKEKQFYSSQESPVSIIFMCCGQITGMRVPK